MMTIHVPPDLAREVGCPASVVVDDRPDLKAVMTALETQCPALVRALVEADWTFRPHLAVFIGGRRLPAGSGLAVALPGGTEIFVLRAVSGG